MQPRLKAGAYAPGRWGPLQPVSFARPTERQVFALPAQAIKHGGRS